MEWGSVADWLGGIGGAGGASSAATFYFMDRRRNKNDREAATREQVSNHQTITDEFKKEVTYSLQSLAIIDENRGVSDSEWAYNNGILSNHQRRLRELSSISTRDIRLHLAISKAAHSLSFSNLPLQHTALWFENIAIAEGELQAALELLVTTAPTR